MSQRERKARLQALLNGAIQIEKNVPLPSNQGKYGAKYPFRQMKVGDSFLFPRTTTRNGAYSSAGQAAVRIGAKFIVRMTDQGFRCWRTA